MNSKNTTIIIGAGIAGLAASKTLTDLGHQPLILEARNRIGGRIFTNSQLGFPVNLGACWLHGDQDNPLSPLARLTNTLMQPICFENIHLYDQHNHPIPASAAQAFHEKLDIILHAIKQTALRNSVDKPLRAYLQPALQAADLSEVEQALLIRQLSYFQGYHGADYDYLSARHWDLEESWPGNQCYMTSSYQPIIEYLASQAHIELNTQVKAIHLREHDVQIITETATYTAEKVIITLPLGVLKSNHVEFNPPLPADKQQAISQIGMGLLNATIVQFPQSFWPTDAAGFVLSDLASTSIPVYLNLSPFVGKPVLMGYHGGDRSKRIEKLSDHDLKMQIMADLKKIFTNISIPEPSALITTRWSQDPYSFGSYSYVGVGADASNFLALAKPIANRLFFAGEATTPNYFATTHGAYLSGIRAAESVVQ